MLSPDKSKVVCHKNFETKIETRLVCSTLRAVLPWPCINRLLTLSITVKRFDEKEKKNSNENQIQEFVEVFFASKPAKVYVYSVEELTERNHFK